MRREAAIGFGAMLALGLWDPAAAAEYQMASSDPARPTLTYAKRPTGEDFARTYPRLALSGNRDGAAALWCALTADGLLTDCKVLGETPEGDGFGAAALKMSAHFLLRPVAGDTRSMEGMRITIPIRYQVEGVPFDGTLNLNNGSDHKLVTELSAKTRGKGPVFDCPTRTKPKRRCQVHVVRSVTVADPVQANTILAKAGLDQGQSTLECAVASDGGLDHCVLGGVFSPPAEAAAFELSKLIRLEPKAEDGVPTASGHLIFQIDWARVKPILAAAVAPAG